MDFTAAYPLIDRLAADRDEWLDLLDDLRVISIAALEQMRRNRDNT